MCLNYVYVNLAQADDFSWVKQTLHSTFKIIDFRPKKFENIIIYLTLCSRGRTDVVWLRAGLRHATALELNDAVAKPQQ
jgi:hypothetical protein